MSALKHYQLLILGSGPAGCSAAIYAARANLNCALVIGMQPGGQLTTTNKIANWPGEPDEISGVVLMEKMLNQVRKFTSNIITDTIIAAKLNAKPFSLHGENGEYSCDTLIIATGSSPKFLEIPSEQKYLGRGVSTCAVCDGFFYKNKKVIVVGGGNTMAEEALYLAPLATTVTIVHRRDTVRAEAYLMTKLKQCTNVQFEFNAIVDEILGDELGVIGVKLKNVINGEKKTIEAHGVFIAIGHQPNTSIFAGQLAMEEDYIKTGFGLATATNIAGVFAAGDVVVNSHRQAVTAAGSGCSAALDAKSFLLLSKPN